MDQIILFNTKIMSSYSADLIAYTAVCLFMYVSKDKIACNFTDIILVFYIFVL